jgi:hypothetical protein
MGAVGSGQELRVEVQGLELGDEHAERINKAVQRAVLSELAQLDLVRDDVVVHFPRDWIGILIRPQRLEQ